MGIKGPHLNMIKTLSDKSSANIVLNGEKLEVFLIR